MMQLLESSLHPSQGFIQLCKWYLQYFQRKPIIKIHVHMLAILRVHSYLSYVDAVGFPNGFLQRSTSFAKSVGIHKHLGRLWVFH